MANMSDMGDYEKYRFNGAKDVDVQPHSLSASHPRGASDGPPTGYDHGNRPFDDFQFSSMSDIQPQNTMSLVMKRMQLSSTKHYRGHLLPFS